MKNDQALAVVNTLVHEYHVRDALVAATGISVSLKDWTRARASR